MTDDLRRLRDATRHDAPGSAKARSVRDAVARRFPESAELRPVLDRLPSPGSDASAVARVKDGVNQRGTSPSASRWRPARWAAGAAAAALVAGGLAWERLPRPPEALDRPLVGFVALDDVRLVSSGVGHLGGTSAAPDVSWSSGIVDADGPAVLRTREAEVVSRGRVAVLRDARGTLVRPSGDVDVRCLATSEAGPQDGPVAGDVRCLPVSAEGMLARARDVFREDGPEAALNAADEGLARADATGATADELAFVRLQAMVALHRDRDALAAARDLEHPGPREDDSRRIAAALALSLEGCAGAIDDLRLLAPDHADAAAALAACESR